MSHKDHLSEEAADAALRLGAFGALISGGIAAGQAVSAARQGRRSGPEAVADTFSAAAKGGIAAAVGGAAAAAVGGKGFARLASFFAGTAAAAWAMSPRKPAKALVATGRDEAKAALKKAVEEINAATGEQQSGTPKQNAS